MINPSIARFILYAADNGLSAAFGIAVLTLAALRYSADTVGDMALSIAIVTLLVPVISFGMPNLIYSRVAARSKSRSHNFLRLSKPFFIIGLASFFVTTILAWCTNPTFASIYWISAARLPFSYGEFIRSYYRAKNNPAEYIWARIFSTTSCFFLLGAVFATGLGERAMLGVWALEWILFTAFITHSSSRLLINSASVKTLLTSLRSSTHLMVQVICVAVYYRFDQIYIGRFFGPADLAIYSIASRYAEGGNMLFGLVSLTVSPQIISEWKSGFISRKSLIILFGVLVATLIGSAIIYCWGDELFSNSIGDQYAQSGRICAVYFLSSCFSVYGLLGTQIAVAEGFYRAPLYSGLAGAFSCVVLTPIACSLYGTIGAAFITVFSCFAASAVVWLPIILNRR